MDILVTYGSKLGGTAGIAETIGATLAERGHAVTVEPADGAPDPRGYDAAVVAGALYAGRWHADARRFVKRHARTLGAMPVWLCSSGPLDGSAAQGEIAPVRGVAALAARIGARGHVTFGGRLAPDATGVIAGRMAATNAGDWRDMGSVRAWAGAIDRELRADVAPAWSRAER